MSVDDFSCFKGFVEYMVRGYFAGTYLGVLGNVFPEAVDAWYADQPSALATHEARRAFRINHAFLCHANFTLWAETQMAQKTIRLTQYFVNGGIDPFPSHDFFEPWLELSIVEKESPLRTLARIMDHTEAMIRLLSPQARKGCRAFIGTRSNYRSYISSLLDQNWTVPPPVDTSIRLYPASAIEDSFCRKHWKGKVTLPPGCWISDEEIAYICKETCSHCENESRAEANEDEDEIGVYMNPKTGEVQEDSVGGIKIASLSIKDDVVLSS